MKINFTDNRLRKIQPNTKRLYLYDAGQPGLALSITPLGTKTFQCQHWDKVRGKSISKSIGRYPGMSINDAREIAAGLIADIHKGIDVVAEAKSIRDEDTLNQMFEQWLEQHAKPHKSSWDEDVRRYNLYLRKGYGKKKVSWFTQDNVRKWHTDITRLKKQRGQGFITGSTANRTLALLTTVFSKMRPHDDNPCSGVKHFKEQSRDRFLQPEELKRFFSALDHQHTPERLRDFFLLAIFTGARRSNVLSMMWNEIDLNRVQLQPDNITTPEPVWTIPASKSKNNEPMTIPLIVQAGEILRRRKACTKSVFVFPSAQSKTGHFVEPRKAWQSLLARADLKDVRLHDLRRTMGSYLAALGTSTLIIGKVLGHRSQESTAVYARLDIDPVRNSMQGAVDLMLKSKDLPDKVRLIK